MGGGGGAPGPRDRGPVGALPLRCLKFFCSYAMVRISYTSAHQMSCMVGVNSFVRAERFLGDITQTVNAKEVSSKDIFGRHQPNC